MDTPILAVDLDGTLLKTDTLVESVTALLCAQPISFFTMLIMLLRGRALFKAWVADQITLDLASLPFNTELLKWLQAEHQKGRKLVLVTAANQRIADAVAEYTGLFDEVLASDSESNLKSTVKADKLVACYGVQGFDYVGNSLADISVWRVADQAIVVGREKLVSTVREVADVSEVFTPEISLWATLKNTLRLHQWIKNLLIFLPLLAAHRFFDTSSLLMVIVGFFVFNLTASAVYVFNDLVDLATDRHHAYKCQRSLASGHCPLILGWLLIPILLSVAILLSIMWLPLTFLGVLIIYCILAVWYSLVFKRFPMLDVMILASLYTIRVIAGAVAIAVVPSFWLLAFSLFIFLSLAMVKRFSELQKILKSEKMMIQGRGWYVDDLPLISAIGISSGVLSILVFALYIDSQTAAQLYQLPEVLWLICPLLLYWISYLWLTTHRGNMHDDPIVFALCDKTSLLISVLMVIIVIFAVIGYAEHG